MMPPGPFVIDVPQADVDDLRDVIGPLTDPASHGADPADAFDVVVASLPGFGFSTPLPRSGIDVPTVARLWVELMRGVLGYDRFGAYGGDWGAIVTAHLGHAFAQHLIGVELSLPVIPGVNRRELGPEAFAADEQWMVARNADAEPFIRSHVAVHTADPQTLAYALADSPTPLDGHAEGWPLRPSGAARPDRRRPAGLLPGAPVMRGQTPHRELVVGSETTARSGCRGQRESTRCMPRSTAAMSSGRRSAAAMIR